jgi:hypothetical protein
MFSINSLAAADNILSRRDDGRTIACADISPFGVALQKYVCEEIEAWERCCAARRHDWNRAVAQYHVESADILRRKATWLRAEGRDDLANLIDPAGRIW